MTLGKIGWYSCASGTPGVVTNQNPQESKHCTFKQCVCKGSLNKSTQKVLEYTIPDILAHQDENFGPKNLTYFDAGHIPCGMVKKAIDSTNSRRIQSYTYVDEKICDTNFKGYVIYHEDMLVIRKV